MSYFCAYGFRIDNLLLIRLRSDFQRPEQAPHFLSKVVRMAIDEVVAARGTAIQVAVAQHGFEDFLALQSQRHQHSQTLRRRFVQVAPADLPYQRFAAKFLQVIGGLTRPIFFGVYAQALLDLDRQVAAGESSRLRRKGTTTAAITAAIRVRARLMPATCAAPTADGSGNDS